MSQMIRSSCVQIVVSGDAHQSEYVMSRDKRIEFLSGFTGSAGTALITRDRAWLITDGRYTIQAAQQLNLTTWSVLQSGGTDFPTLSEHILNCLGADKTQRIGIDASTMPLSTYRSVSKSLKSHTLVALDQSPVDKVWEDLGLRPPRQTTPSFVHPISLAGLSAESKLEGLRAALKTEGANAVIISALDEVR